jgi:carboxyl-terminal processing protease
VVVTKLFEGPSRGVVAVGGVLAAVILSLASVPACQAEPPRPRVQVAAVKSDAATAHLEHLAESGRFDEVLTRLRNDYADLATPAVQTLIDHLERFDQREDERRAERLEAFDAAMARVEKQLAEDRLEDALISAIEAHSLADDPSGVLTTEPVKNTVAAARARAQAAEEAGDWVEALSLYRAMDLLYDDYATFRSEVKRVAKHVQVLQLYVPTKLQELYRAQAARRAAREADRENNEDAEVAQRPDPPSIEIEDWRVRLNDVDASMLRQTLAQAARQHVESAGYAALMRGSLDSLLVMLNTDDVATAFPAFNDGEQRDRFRNELRGMRANLDEPRTLNFIETAQLITEILDLNQKTLKLPEQVIVYELTEGATTTLDDFTSVIWPSDKEQFSRSTQGRFFGVGIQIKRENNQLMVVTPLPGTPALQAGIKAGDIIATVDDKDTSVWSLDKAVREITGPEGTEVRLGIRRAGEADLIEFALRRAEIEIESIRGWKHTDDGDWDFWIDRDARIGYVRLSQFIPQTADNLDEAIARMQKDGPLNGLILDLRFNPGGLLSSAVDVVDRFIKEGPIVYTVDGSGTKQNQSRAIVVGTRTFGKGSVQDLFPLSHGKAYLKLTTQYYQLPLGRIIHRKPDAREWGVVPDLVVDMTNQQVAAALEYRQEVDVLRDKDFVPENGDPRPTAEGILETGIDPQLSAALLVLKTRQVARDLAVAQAQSAKNNPATVP